MNILNLIEESGCQPKRKASTHGGEYCSPCPFCNDGDDRFLIWPQRQNKNGDYQGGRFSCRVCGKYGDAITFLIDLRGMSYRDACAQLKIQPKRRSNSIRTIENPKPNVVPEPPELWKEKSNAFVEWSHNQLMDNEEALNLIKKRGLRDDSIVKFRVGFNPKTFFRDREDWGLSSQVKEDGKKRKLWLPAGIIIPTFSNEQVCKIKIRRSEWKEGDKWPKYVEVSGSKQTPSIYGNTSLPYAIVMESEIDALLVLQEAHDLCYCVALGGSTKSVDLHTHMLLRNTQNILFCPDFDEAGVVAWVRWKKIYPNIHRILTPEEKSPGDAYLVGIDLRGWISEKIKEIQS